MAQERIVMYPSRLLYNLAAGVGSLALPAFFLASALHPKLAEQRPRLGMQGHLPFTPQAERGVWMQAVSVGEVEVAKAIAHALWNEDFSLNLTITSSTPQGLCRAQRELGLRAQVAPFPFDFAWAVQAAVRRLRPRVYVSLETEIWPNLLWALHARQTKILLLNGRISPRSFPRYQKIKSLLASCWSCFACLSMISEHDAERIIALGADPSKVRVDGNAKYSVLSQRMTHTANQSVLRQRLNLAGSSLLVAGSVRGGEEEPILEAFALVRQQTSQAVLLVAPRHIRRTANWLSAARQRDLPAARWSDFTVRPPEAAVVVLDEMGQLFDFYALARAVYVGASLVNKGGQNPLEPAAWGVPVAFGPYMDDFADAKDQLLSVQAAKLVKNSRELAEFWLKCVLENSVATLMGQRGQAQVAGLPHTARTGAQLILQHLES